MRSPTLLFTRSVGTAMQAPPPIVSARASCRDAVQALCGTAAPLVAVVDERRGLCGLLSAEDVVQRIAFRVPPETAVATVMTTPVHTLGDGEPLYRAIARMRRFGQRQLPVQGSDGRLVGILRLDDALAEIAPALLASSDRLVQDDSPDGLRATKRSQVELVDALLAEDMPGPDIQWLLTAVNSSLYRRIVEIEVEDMAIAGWGPLPVDFTVIVMGSGGRGENDLGPDQDNGFVLADYEDRRHGGIDPFFIELADRMTRMLDLVGFPLCRGHVMAINPVWRKTTRQWRAQVDGWLRKRNYIALRMCDILFDFQPVFGDPGRSAELRSWIADRLKGNHAFLGDMYRGMADHGVALGPFGRLVPAGEDDGDGDVMDLKYGGTLPLVEAMRLLALREGIAETSTLRRIDALRGASVLSDEEHEELSDAYRHVVEWLLRQQVADLKDERSASNRVPLDRLSRRQRSRLVAALGAIRRFRERLKGEFAPEM